MEYFLLSILPLPLHLISCNTTTSILYFGTSRATSAIFPTYNTVFTFHVARFSVVFRLRVLEFLSCPSSSKLSFRGFLEGFVTKIFSKAGLLALRLTPNLEGHFLSLLFFRTPQRVPWLIRELTAPPLEGEKSRVTEVRGVISKGLPFGALPLLHMVPYYIYNWDY